MCACRTLCVSHAVRVHLCIQVKKSQSLKRGNLCMCLYAYVCVCTRACVRVCIFLLCTTGQKHLALMQPPVAATAAAAAFISLRT